MASTVRDYGRWIEDNKEQEALSLTTTTTDIVPVSIADEMQRSYLDYAMSVIVSRALPDARDGLKPVHRRILYSAYESGHLPERKYVKSARIVGDVIGLYHPHGDQSIYDALVRMAQDFSMRMMLIDGQGNFGSVDGDPAAAMRYTESRLTQAAVTLLTDIDKDTVDFQPNYDDSSKEPKVLPARFPNLLVNGAGGIAVGMATNIPPHNLGEIIDACIALVEDPLLSDDQLYRMVPGPDFPTGGIILGQSGALQAYKTGRGMVMMRSAVHTEVLRKDREAIVVTEIPYQVNKASLIEKIAELVKDKRVEGIHDLRDESDRMGMRIVIELKKDVVSEIILNQLYRFTNLQTTFSCNLVALHQGRPELMTLRRLIEAFITFREEVVTRRTQYLLEQARARAHILCGLSIAVHAIDEMITLIRNARNPQEAREAMRNRTWNAEHISNWLKLIDLNEQQNDIPQNYRLSEEQIKAILDLRLQRLTALGLDELTAELTEKALLIENYLKILGSREVLMKSIVEDLEFIKKNFGTERKTQIIQWESEIDDEDLIQKEDMVVTVSHAGYIKRVPLSTYRAQKRGGKGRSGMSTREEDFVTRLFVANTHYSVLFFSNLGKVYKEKVWRLPLSTPHARGKALVNILSIDSSRERITTILPLEAEDLRSLELNLVFATASGFIRRNKLSDFMQINRSGKIAMRLEDGDYIVHVEVCSEDEDILLTTKLGQCVRFPVGSVRVFKGRDSYGVKGITLTKQDRVISMTILKHFDASLEERSAFLKMWRQQGEDPGMSFETSDDAILEDGVSGESDGPVSPCSISQQRYEEMLEAQQYVLTISERGFGKRTSSFEFRATNRGGKGITAMRVNKRNGCLVSSFPVNPKDHVMLVTNNGQLIRMPIEGIRVVGRTSMGVNVFETGVEDYVVSVEHIVQEDTDSPEHDMDPE